MQPVFRDYDQKALDDAYDQAAYAPNRDQILARRDRSSELARQRLGEPQRFAYGAGRNEQLDFYPTAKGNHIQVFIHGGAWRAGRASEYAAAAEMFVHAGAHLGGVLAASDWEKDFGLPRDLVKGYTLCSDLRGPRLSKRSAYVKSSDEMEAALSPQRHLDCIHAPIVLLYGSLETPEFKRQSQEFAEALQAAGKPVELICAEGYNHFEIGETLAHPYGPMGRAVLQQMGLSPRP